MVKSHTREIAEKHPEAVIAVAKKVDDPLSERLKSLVEEVQ